MKSLSRGSVSPAWNTSKPPEVCLEIIEPLILPDWSLPVRSMCLTLSQTLLFGERCGGLEDVYRMCVQCTQVETPTDRTVGNTTICYQYTIYISRPERICTLDVTSIERGNIIFKMHLHPTSTKQPQTWRTMTGQTETESAEVKSDRKKWNTTVTIFG